MNTKKTKKCYCGRENCFKNKYDEKIRKILGLDRDKKK